VLVDGLPTGTGVAVELASRVAGVGVFVPAGRAGMLGRATPPAGVAADLLPLAGVPTTGVFVPRAGVLAGLAAGGFVPAAGVPATTGFIAPVVGAGPTTGAFAGVVGIAPPLGIEPVAGRTGGAAGRAAAAGGFAALAFGSAALSSPLRREYPGMGGGRRRGGGGESLLFDTGQAFRAPDVGTRTLAP